jgi:hypothetical protein
LSQCMRPAALRGASQAALHLVAARSSASFCHSACIGDVVLSGKIENGEMPTSQLKCLLISLTTGEWWSNQSHTTTAAALTDETADLAEQDQDGSCAALVLNDTAHANTFSQNCRF